MNTSRVRVVVALAGAAGLAAHTLGQQAVAAPTSAQRFETRFKIERFAPDGFTLLSSTFASNIALYDSGPITYDTTASVGRVDITYQGRVGILPNSAGTENLGISRLGGAGSATTGGRIFFNDLVAQGVARNQGTVELAATGAGTAAGGVPNKGIFAPFRGTLAGWSAASNGSNTDSNNGQLSNTATGSPVIFNFTGGRTANYGTPGENYGANTDGFNGSGPISGAATIDGTTLAGSFADYYKLTYRADATGDLGARLISAQAQGQSGRYIFKYNGGGAASNGASFNIAITNLSFAIPSPAVATPLALSLIHLARRRHRRA